LNKFIKLNWATKTNITNIYHSPGIDILAPGIDHPVPHNPNKIVKIEKIIALNERVFIKY